MNFHRIIEMNIMIVIAEIEAESMFNVFLVSQDHLCQSSDLEPCFRNT